MTTVMLDRDETIVICKKVPAQVCQTCGEVYLDATITRRLEHIVEEAARGGI